MQNSIAKKLKNDYQIEMGNLHSKAKLNANCIKKNRKKFSERGKNAWHNLNYMQSDCRSKTIYSKSNSETKTKKRTENSRVRGENS